MAYDITKMTKLGHLKSLAQRVAENYATKDEVNTLRRTVDGIVSVGGEANVLNGVKVNGAELEIVEKMVDILIATGATEGTIAVNGADVAVNGYAALKAIVEALNGTGEGSVDERITAAFNDFATKVSDDNVVNTYKELIDYAADHGPEFTELVGKVTALEGQAHTHDNKEVIDGITAEKIAAWDAAETNAKAYVDNMIATDEEVAEMLAEVFSGEATA